ncbi:MAG: hypothetical protein ACKV2T_14050 [Kofleriaceae bacterium]
MFARVLVFTVGAMLVALPLAYAKPAADVVIVWAPGAKVKPLEDAARDAGVAVIDRSPAARAARDTGAAIARGMAEFDALRTDEAAKLLDEAKAEVDRTGGADLVQSALSDLFLYRARVAADRGDTAGSWDALTTAVIVAPARVIDPGRFAPSVREEIERARAAVATRPKAALVVNALAGCRVMIDGAPATQAPYVIGPHWVHVACPDREPWGTRVELVAADMVIKAGNLELAAPSDDELLVQARAVAARAFVGIRVQGGVAMMRLVGADGRELDRRAVRVEGDLAPAVPALRSLLSGSSDLVERRWYRSPWFWAGVGAVIGAGIALPIALSSDNTQQTFPTRVPVTPPGWNR